MFSKLFNKKPSADEQCYSMSTLLLKNEDSSLDTPYKRYLEEDKLDYSLESLIVIDAYLSEVHKKKKTLNDDDLSKIILRCGAYVGEVIKKNSKLKFKWMFYDDLVRHDKFLKDFGKSILTNFVLTSKEGGSTCPMAKVEKYIAFGQQESLHFYAQALGKL